MNTIPQFPAERIRHDSLFDYVCWVGREPVDLGRETPGPEVDGRSGEFCVGGKVLGEEIVRAPPEEEERTEEEGGSKTMVDASDAVGSELGERHRISKADKGS